MRKPTHEMPDILDKRNGKTTKNQRKRNLETLPEMWYSSRERNETEGRRKDQRDSRLVFGVVAASFLSCLHFRPWFGKRHFPCHLTRKGPVRTYLIYRLSFGLGSDQARQARKGSGYVGRSGNVAR